MTESTVNFITIEEEIPFEMMPYEAQIYLLNHFIKEREDQENYIPEDVQHRTEKRIEKTLMEKLGNDECEASRILAALRMDFAPYGIPEYMADRIEQTADAANEFRNEAIKAFEGSELDVAEWDIFHDDGALDCRFDVYKGGYEVYTLYFYAYINEDGNQYLKSVSRGEFSEWVEVLGFKTLREYGDRFPHGPEHEEEREDAWCELYAESPLE